MAALGLGALATACANASDEVEVFAAASLTNAFTEIAEAYEADGGDPVRLNFAGSSALREQLRDGAEADVFASANERIMDELVADETITGVPRALAQNQLVLAVPRGNPGGVSDLGDLADADLYIGLCSSGVPCGDLARSVLDEAGVSASVDTELPDVRSLARRIADGELDVGLVYASDVVADAELQVIASSELDGSGVRYPITTVDSDNAAADDFVDFALGPVGSAILQRWGFQAP